jgi:hypothetical protein
MFGSVGNILHLPALILGILVGMAALWLRPDDRVVTIYPSPENVDKMQYKDAAGTCFTYTQSPAKCPVGGGIKPTLQ